MDNTSGTPLLIALSAPSGGGKTTLCHQILNARPTMARAITCTTRAPRGAEKDAVDYYFLTEKDFQERVDSGLFLEHAVVYGKRYGTLKTEVLQKLRAGHDVILSMDVQGVQTVLSKAGTDPELKAALITVFLTPPSLDILEQRLCKRGADSSQAVRERLSVAKDEISHWRSFDYLIISTSIAEDLRRLESIIDAEKMRSARARLPQISI